MITQQRRYSRRQAVLAGLAAMGGLVIVDNLDSTRALARNIGTGQGVNGRVPGHLVAATRDFGFRLLNGLVAGQPDRNVFISPSSIATALAMTYNGTAGATRQAMAATLGLQGMSVHDANQAYALLAATLRGLDPHVTLTIANSLWSRQNVPFNPAFVAALQQYYGAAATTLDFADPRASVAINGWVDRQTHGKIARIAPDRLDPAMILYLINAIYFKGRWTVPFDKGQTRQHPFALSAGGQKVLPMMTRTGSFPYYRGADFQGVSLPYGAGKWSMVVLLPDAGSDLGALRARLTAGAWDSWLSQFKPSFGTIVLPRFKVDYAHTLNQVLIALGMGDAFSRQANFSGLTPATRARISAVDHAALMEVDEEGTTAAAVTSVGIQMTAARAPGFTLIVDRPFLCAIRDSTTGTVLFAGLIVDPSSQ